MHPCELAQKTVLDELRREQQQALLPCIQYAVSTVLARPRTEAQRGVSDENNHRGFKGGGKREIHFLVRTEDESQGDFKSS